MRIWPHPAPSSTPLAGQNCLPADGIGAVSDQLAARLPAASIRLNTPAAAVAGSPAAGGAATVTLADGSSLAAKAVVVAVEGPEAGRLLGPALAAAPSKPAPGVGTCGLYFAAPLPARWAAEGCLWGFGDAACTCSVVWAQQHVRPVVRALRWHGSFAIA